MMAGIGNWAYVLKSKLAVASARRGDDPLRLAHRIRHLGDAYYYAGRWASAEGCYVEALSIYRLHERTPPLDLANAIRSFAVLKDEGGAAEQAQGLWQEAHDLYVSLQIAAGVAETAARLALLARRHGDLARSRASLAEASAAAATTNDPETLQYIRDVTAQLGSVHTTPE
jgi:tetratricopeptide (TPR) repeat protein